MTVELVLTLLYHQATGALEGLSQPVTGYSGFPPFTNDPGAEGNVAHGPIPKGRWLIGVASDAHAHLGPVAIPLTPDAGTDTRGRSGFFIHGDSVANPGYASHGCVILPRSAREEIVKGCFGVLEVVE